MVSEWVSDGFDWKPGELITSGICTQSPRCVLWVAQPISTADKLTHELVGILLYTHQVACNFSVLVLLACNHPCCSHPCVLLLRVSCHPTLERCERVKNNNYNMIPRNTDDSMFVYDWKMQKKVLFWHDSWGISLKMLCKIGYCISRCNAMLKATLNLTK